MISINEFVAPKFNLNAFNCPHCKAYAEQKWEIEVIVSKIKPNRVRKLPNFLPYTFETFERFDSILEFQEKQNKKNNILPSNQQITEKILVSKETTVALSTCCSCSKYHLWHDEKMVFPNISSAPSPSIDMPEDVKKDYLEAREVLSKSPKSSAALLRLALQKLCKHLGGKGKNINHDIGFLVKEKNLDIKIQQALDSIRIVGNNAVHPGTIDFEDTPEIVEILFDMLNIIVEETITREKNINSFYKKNSENKRKSIKKRDSK